MWESKHGSAKHHPLIRTIYLYLFTIIGLALLVVGGVRFVDMGLKAFVFTQAEERLRTSAIQPPMPYQLERIEAYQTGEVTLSEAEHAAIKQWLDDYQNWQTSEAKVDPVTSRRHETAAGSLAAILIGLLLYLYHWGVIKRETDRREKEEK